MVSKAEKKIRLEKQKNERKEQKQPVALKAHRVLAGEKVSGVITGKNLFETFSAIQEQNPSAIIAAFQATGKYSFYCGCIHFHYILPDDDAKSEGSDVVDRSASGNVETTNLTAEKLFDSDED
jgi:hypothetical protein